MWRRRPFGGDDGNAKERNGGIRQKDADDVTAGSQKARIAFICNVTRKEKGEMVVYPVLAPIMKTDIIKI